jgi:hypothetical protein
MRKLLKRFLGLGLLGALVYALWRAAEGSRAGDAVVWEPQPFPYPPQPRQAEPASASPAAGAAPWVEPADGECPATHPVKAKLTSGIFHEPGSGNYARTRPDRCYRDADAARADGLRPPRR